MLDFLFSGGQEAALSIPSALLTITAAALMGLLISFTYMKTCNRESYSQNFILTLMMIAPIIAIIILLVGSNVARAFSLAGAFSIIRFRSNPGDPRDIAYIFFTLAAGLACGVGLVGYGVVFTVFLCVAAWVLFITKFGTPRKPHKQLQIAIPENLNYSDAFEDIFAKFVDSVSLDTVKSKEMGSVFELHYDVVMKTDGTEKDFLDELRCRNGNLSIMLTSNIEKE